MKCQIFINYRKGDSNDATNWLYERLKEKFGSNTIFMDTASIETGDNWEEDILKKLEEAQIVLIIIGKQWLTVGVDLVSSGLRRIDQEDDWVRKEIEAALKRKKTIYPILIDDAVMPLPNALPDSIKILLNVQYYVIKVNSGPNSGVEGLYKILTSKLNNINSPDELREGLEKSVNNKYKITKQIGRGPMFKVYLAKDEALDRNVTIRAVQDPLNKSEFIDTIRSAAKIVESVPNFTQLLGAWIEKEPIHVVMSYLEGGTLREIIDENDNRGLPFTDVHKILTALGNALIIAHKVGITHCNIKPSNIFLTTSKEPYLSPLCRFQKTNKTYILNKLALRAPYSDAVSYREELCYLSPEIFDSNYIEKSQDDRNKKIDQYMLGLLAYELLSGRIPNTISIFREDLQVDAFNKLDSISSVRKDCPINLANIVHKMIEYDPYKRYESMEAAISEIEKVSFNDIEIAKESYARCILNNNLGNGFFKVFYKEFIRLAPDAAKKFSDRGIGEESAHKQYEKLREAIFILFIFAEKKLGNEEPNVLTRIAERHNNKNYDISLPFYNEFVKALTNTVCGAPPFVPEGFDYQCKKSANEKERIKKAWEKALEPGIDYMTKKYW